MADKCWRQSLNRWREPCAPCDFASIASRISEMTRRNGGGAGSRSLSLGHVWLQVSFRYDDCDIVIVGVVWLWWLWYWLLSFVCVVECCCDGACVHVCVYVICVFDGVCIFEGMADTCWRRSLNRWCEPCSINDVHHLIFAFVVGTSEMTRHNGWGAGWRYKACLPRCLCLCVCVGECFCWDMWLFVWNLSNAHALGAWLCDCSCRVVIIMMHDCHDGCCLLCVVCVGVYRFDSVWFMVRVFVWVVCVCVLVHVFMGKRLTRVDDAHLIGDASHAQSMMWLHLVILLLIR
jgi:hypothetical protein